jgi:hypothetical protein
MDRYREYLIEFRDLVITKQELFELIPRQSQPKYEPIIVSNRHLISLLQEYKTGTVNEQYILDWVNTIWFTDWFTYDNNYCDTIASVMTELEEIDEEGKELNIEKVNYYIGCLEDNMEF